MLFFIRTTRQTVPLKSMQLFAVHADAQNEPFGNTATPISVLNGNSTVGIGGDLKHATLDHGFNTRGFPIRVLISCLIKTMTST